MATGEAKRRALQATGGDEVVAVHVRGPVVYRQKKKGRVKTSILRLKPGVPDADMFGINSRGDSLIGRVMIQRAKPGVGVRLVQADTRSFDNDFWAGFASAFDPSGKPFVSHRFRFNHQKVPKKRVRRFLLRAPLGDRSELVDDWTAVLADLIRSGKNVAKGLRQEAGLDGSRALGPSRQAGA